MTILDLPDDLFMLALCVRPENLKDPAKWCSKIRTLHKAVQAGPTTVAEAEELMAQFDCLADESADQQR